MFKSLVVILRIRVLTGVCFILCVQTAAQSHPSLRGSHADVPVESDLNSGSRLLSEAALMRIDKAYANKKILEFAKSIVPETLNSYIDQSIDKSKEFWSGQYLGGMVSLSLHLGEVRVNDVAVTASIDDGINAAVTFSSKNERPGIMVEVRVRQFLNFGKIGFINIENYSVWVHIETLNFDMRLQTDDDWFQMENLSVDIPALAVSIGSKKIYKPTSPNMNASFPVALIKGVAIALFSFSLEELSAVLKDILPDKINEKLRNALEDKIEDKREDFYTKVAHRLPLPSIMNLDKSDAKAVVIPSRFELTEETILLWADVGISPLGPKTFEPTYCFGKTDLELEDWQTDAPIALHANPNIIHNLAFELWQSGRLQLDWNSDMPMMKKINMPFVSAFSGTTTVELEPDFEDCFVAYFIKMHGIDLIADLTTQVGPFSLEGNLEASLLLKPEFSGGVLTLNLRSLIDTHLKLESPDPNSYKGGMIESMFNDKFLPEIELQFTDYRLMQHILEPLESPLGLSYQVSSLDFMPELIEAHFEEVAPNLEGTTIRGRPMVSLQPIESY